IPVRVPVVEERDAMVVGELTQLDATLVAVVSPPVHAENPAAERDRGDFQRRIAEGATEHRWNDILSRTCRQSTGCLNSGPAIRAPSASYAALSPLSSRWPTSSSSTPTSCAARTCRPTSP